MSPPVTASDGSATLLDAMTAGTPANGGSLPVSDVSSFSLTGGIAHIDPGSPSEESIAYTGVDAATSSLLGLVRSVPLEHPAGAPIAASIITPCEMLGEPPTDRTALEAACEEVDARVDAFEEGLLDCTSQPVMDCLPPLANPCESDTCEILDVCAATNGCDLSEPVPGVDVDPTDTVLAAAPDHGDCTATSGGVFRNGNFIGGDGSFDCTANQHFIVTVKVTVKVKTAGVWDEFAVGAAAAESSCCIGAGATAACSPGTNFKYRVVTAGKAANSEGDVVHEDKDRGWDTVDRIACPGGLTFLL